MAVNIVPIIKDVARREWHDVEPKLIAGLLSGGLATAAVAEVAHLGFVIDPFTASLVTTLFSFAGGWLKSSNAVDYALTPKAADPKVFVPDAAVAAVDAVAADLS